MCLFPSKAQETCQDCSSLRSSFFKEPLPGNRDGTCEKCGILYIGGYTEGTFVIIFNPLWEVWRNALLIVADVVAKRGVTLARTQLWASMSRKDGKEEMEVEGRREEARRCVEGRWEIQVAQLCFAFMFEQES